MADFARSAHPGVQAQLDRLAKLSPAGDRLGLERVRDLLDRLGRPQDRLPPIFHVAGTNGKGSTVAFLRAALEAANRKVHVFTSPHLVRFNERIRVAGQLIDDEPLAELLAEVIDAGAGIEPSFFEVATVVALLAFAQSDADACILEVGLGGRLDATNIVDCPAVTGIASLALDHQHFLGTRLADIAAEKAGIAKLGVPLVTQLYPPQIATRIGEIARDKQAVWVPRGQAWNASARRGRLHYEDRAGSLELPLPRLPGRYQAVNAGLAIAMLRHQSALHLTPEALAEGLAAAEWPARMQRLADGPLLRLLPNGSELWLDGGHNADGGRAVANALADLEERVSRPLVLIVGMLASKDASAFLKNFSGLARTLFAVSIPDQQKTIPAGDIAELARAANIPAQASDGIESALAAVGRLALDPPPRVMITGSLYLAGAVLKANGTLPS